jgi:hypothetical protein
MPQFPKFKDRSAVANIRQGFSPGILNKPRKMSPGYVYCFARRSIDCGDLTVFSQAILKLLLMIPVWPFSQQVSLFLLPTRYARRFRGLSKRTGSITIFVGPHLALELQDSRTNGKLTENLRNICL